METKEGKKRTFLEAIGNLLFSDFLFKREMVNRKYCYHIMQKDEMRICKYSAIVILIIEIIISISSLINSSRLFDNHGLYLVARITLILVSITLIIANHFLSETRKYIGMRIVCLLFYFSIIACTTIFMSGNLDETNDSFSLAFLFLLVLAFSPTTFLIDNFILFGLSLTGVSLSVFVFSDGSDFWYRYYLLLIIFLFIALVFRSIQVRSTIYQVKEHEMHEVLKIQTYTDTLTCALNRRALEELLFDNFDNWKSNSENVALIMFDVDNFKEYNDNFSHSTGDEVLKRVASMASQLCNKNMPNIFRYGGDEFFMVVVGSDRLDVLTKSLDLLRSIAKLKMKRSKEEELYLTISIGVQMLNNKIDSPAEFISAVDEDLYFAKNNGKACVAFEKKIYR